MLWPPHTRTFPNWKESDVIPRSGHHKEVDPYQKVDAVPGSSPEFLEEVANRISTAAPSQAEVENSSD